MGTKSTINPLDILYFINFMDNDIFSLSKLKFISDSKIFATSVAYRINLKLLNITFDNF